jgi:AraC-like DNA-binding protein
MRNEISGFSVRGSQRRRMLGGIVADLWDVACEPFAGGHYVAADPRLFIVLEASGGSRSGISLSPSARASEASYSGPALSFVPAEMELWAGLKDIAHIRHLDLHFSRDALDLRFGEDLDPLRMREPRLMFSDTRLMTLAEMIAAECANPDPLHDLYLDGLAMALLVDLLKIPKPRSGRRSPLAGWQLRRVKDYMEANCLHGIRLDELAALTGLSPSYFSHAFKAATGMAPHQWQLKIRVERAKALLATSDHSLPALAQELGFADQAHFTRVFRKLCGTTPARWRKSRGIDETMLPQ